jgi:hypothetical protein
VGARMRARLFGKGRGGERSGRWKIWRSSEIWGRNVGRRREVRRGREVGRSSHDWGCEIGRRSKIGRRCEIWRQGKTRRKTGRSGGCRLGRAISGGDGRRYCRDGYWNGRLRRRRRLRLLLGSVVGRRDDPDRGFCCTRARRAWSRTRESGELLLLGDGGGYSCFGRLRRQHFLRLLLLENGNLRSRDSDGRLLCQCRGLGGLGRTGGRRSYYRSRS